MADISEWSPVDESNTAAPPNGWPENQQVSSVNNCARAMMGAVRRWYDTITAQLSTLTSQVTGMLPLSGGAMTGQIYSNSNISTSASVIAGSSIVSYNAIDATNAITGGALVSNSNVNAAAHVNAAQYDLRGLVFAEMDAGGGRTAIYDPGSGGLNIILYASGTNYYDNDEHQIRSRGSSAYALFNFTGSYNVTGSWGVISDRAAKSDIAPYTRGLSAIQALRPVSYRYSSGPFRGEATHYGLVAQDVEPLVPEMVEEADFGNERMLTMQPGHLVFVLCNAVQELAVRLQALEEKSDV